VNFKIVLPRPKPFDFSPSPSLSNQFFDYSMEFGQLEKKNISLRDIGKKLGISEGMVRKGLKSKEPF
jgi:hypothetical protein